MTNLNLNDRYVNQLFKLNNYKLRLTHLQTLYTYNLPNAS